MKDSTILAEDFKKSIGVIQVPQNPALISDSVAAPTHGSKANASKRAVSFTDADPKRLITGEIIIGTHVYQPPLIDGLKTVGNIAKSLVDGIFNFQQTSYRSWFSLRPQLIIRSSQEFVEIGANRLDDTALAMGYKKLASRVANRVYHYLEANKLLICAMYNLASLSRFEGDTVLKSFASDFRSSLLNTILANAAKYPLAKGVYDQIKATCIYLAGVTADGVPVISLPRIDVSVFGNQSVHCNTPSNFISLDGEASIDPLAIAKDGSARFMTSEFSGDYSPAVENAMAIESEDSALFDLLRNIEATIYHFAGGKKRMALSEARLARRTETGRNDYELARYEVEDAIKYSYDFRGPEVINMANVNVGSEGNFNAMARLNGGGPLLLDDHVADQRMKYDFSRIVMNQAFEIMRYIEENFHDFAIPGNDWYELVVNDLKLCEPSGIRMSQMITDARGMKYGDINEYLDKTKTTDKAPVSTTSVIKYMPIFGDTDQDDHVGSAGEMVHSAEYIGNNFCRFDFSLENANFTLRNAKRVPRFNPTLFFVDKGEAGVKIFAANTGPNFRESELMSVKNDDTPIAVDHAFLVNGQRALYDYSRIVQNDPSIAKMKFSGIDPERAKEIVDADTMATVFYEDKTQVFVDSLPSVDFSDPTANGFSILFFGEGKFPSMITRELMNPDNFVENDAEKKVPTRGITDVTTVATGLMPLSPSVFQDAYPSEGCVPATQASPEYIRHFNGCVEGFVGASLMAIPAETSMLTPTGTFATCHKITGADLATFYNKGVVGSEVERGIKTPLSSAVTEEGGIASFKTAIIPMTVCKDAKTALNDKLLANSNVNVLDLLKGMAAGASDSYIMYKYIGSETGRVRLNMEASPLDGIRQGVKGLLPDNLQWDTASVKVRLGQLHNGVDNTNEDAKGIDPILDGMMDGEHEAVARSSLTVRQITTAAPVVDGQAIRYADYPFTAYTGTHFLGKDMFLLKVFCDVEVTAVGTTQEEYFLDIIGKAIKDNYCAPVTGQYSFTSNHYVAEVFVKIDKRDYAARNASSTNRNRDGGIKTVHFSADKAGSGDHRGASDNSDDGKVRKGNSSRSRGRKRRSRGHGDRVKREVNPSDDHMAKEMADTVGKAGSVTPDEQQSIKDASERGRKSYTASDVM